MFVRKPLRLLGVMVCSAMLLACNPTRSDQRLVTLDATLNSYNKLIRWGEFQNAASYILAREGEESVVDLALTEGIRVTRLETLSQGLSDDGEEARVQNRIEYYRDDSAVVKTLLDNQLWWYDDQRKRWFLDGPLPEFK